MIDFCKHIYTGNSNPGEQKIIPYTHPNNPNIKIVYAPYYGFYAVQGLQEAIWKEFKTIDEAKKFIEKITGEK